MRLVKGLIYLALLGAFVVFGFTVKLGKHTLFGHVQRIWKADETQDLVKGTREKADPTVDKIKRGVKAGVKEAKEEEEK